MKCGQLAKAAVAKAQLNDALPLREILIVTAREHSDHVLHIQPSTNPEVRRAQTVSDPEAAVRKLIEIANSAEAVRLIAPFLAAGGSPAKYRAGIEHAIAKGWLWRHESGTYVKFTDAGAELFA